MMQKYVVAISGASGVVFGLRVMRELALSSEVHLVISATARSIIKEETGLDFSGTIEKTQARVREYAASENVQCWLERDLEAPISSGSFLTDGMFVVPCSMKTLSAIANGYADNLISRAADVTIKEGRRLLIAPREMPLSAIHLENMLKLARLGVKIAPPVPAFYSHPQSLDDMVDFVVGKMLDAMGIKHSLFTRWAQPG